MEKTSSVLDIEEKIKKAEQVYNVNYARICGDFKGENNIKNDYRQRQIYELMQNADDSFSSPADAITIKFTLRDDLLIVQNNGVPFDEKGIGSLMLAHTSTKRKGYIGYKGLGFRSVLNWADSISIYTDAFGVNFSKEFAKQWFNNYIAKHPETEQYFKDNEVDRIAILSIPTIIDDLNRKRQFLEEGFTTAIVLKCKPECIDEIQKQLIDLRFEELLFLNHLERVIISSPKATRDIICVNDKTGHVGIEEAGQSTYWRLFKKEDGPKNGEPPFELIIAYGDEITQREETKKNGFLYSFFKTDIKMPFPFLVHGTFNLSSERNGLVKTDDGNRFILGKLIDLIVETGEKLAEEKPCSYEALEFALPANNIEQLDQEYYHFTSLLKERIKASYLLPTIDGKYLSLNESPKYSQNRFDQFLNKDTFSNLLVKTDNKQIESFLISECKIGFYEAETFCEMINRDCKLYSEKGFNADLIKLYYDQYRQTVNFAPFLLIDSLGQIISDKNYRVFNNPDNIFHLPEWSFLRFIDSKLEKALLDRFELTTGAELANKLQIFNMTAWSFDSVVQELSSQCNNAEKTKSFIKWLYSYWLNVDKNFEFKANDSVKVIANNMTIVDSKQCFFGKEYNNPIGEKIIKSSGKDVAFLASKSVFGLHEEDDEKLIEFFSYIGLAKYPRLCSVILDNNEKSDYLDWVFTLNKLIPVSYSEKRNKSDFVSRMSNLEITVQSVDGLEAILSNCDSESIIYWILNDTNISNAIKSKYETSKNSQMRIQFKYRTYTNTVSNEYMPSYIKRVFSNTKWIPTKSNSKASGHELMFEDYGLSPAIETVKINYSHRGLIDYSAKEEVERILKELGVADNFVSLSKERIYKVLLKLPDLGETGVHLGRSFYSKLNSNYDAQSAKELVDDNDSYLLFKQQGKVLARFKGKLQYLPHDEVYYLENRIYNEDVINYTYPMLELGKRAGKDKIERMFCVKPLDNLIKTTLIDFKEHDCNRSFQDYYLFLQPYLYSRRIAKDNKFRQLRSLRGTSVVIVSYAKIQYSTDKGASSEIIEMKDNELVYIKENNRALIKVSEATKTLDELKNVVSFRTALAELIVTLFDVGADKSIFSNMFSCSNEKELEMILKDEDDNLIALNDSRKLFNQEINYEKEFFLTLENCSGLSREKLSEKGLIDGFIDFDFKNPNYQKIIELFNNINIDVDSFNAESNNLYINLEDYYDNLVTSIKGSYSGKYFAYIAKKCFEEGKTTADFELAQREYGGKRIAVVNSVKFNALHAFEECFGVTIDQLNAVDWHSDYYFSQLKKPEVKDKKEEKVSANENESEPAKTDYDAIKTEVENTTDGEFNNFVPGNTTAQPSHRGGKGGNGQPRTHDPKENASKERNGYTAECKVYYTLKKLKFENGEYLKWVSGNGKNAKETDVGDDTLGYDIELFKDGKIHYIEVKSSTDNIITFTLTANEYEWGVKHPDEYEVWFVHIKEDGKADNPCCLGNIFKFKRGESFLSNSKYIVKNKDFVILMNGTSKSKE